MLYTLERDVPKVQALARRLLAGATERELSLWILVARSFLGWSDVESGRLAEGIETLEKLRGSFQNAHLVYWLPTYLCWLAEAYVRTDKLTEARLCLEQARNVFARRGDHWYEVECHRIEGRVAAHAHVNDVARAERCFEQALALALQRGQHGFALRAAGGLARLLAEGQTERACSLLQGELQYFADQPEFGDRADAEALLSSLRKGPRR
jgi:tetratricopeptide (TPR) repeat protein